MSRHRSTALLVALLVVGASAGAAVASAGAAGPGAATAKTAGAGPVAADVPASERGGSAAPAAARPETPEPPEPNESVDPADAAYVTEDGDVVLAFRENGSDTVTGRLGVDVTRGLVQVLLRNDTRSNVTGAVEATLTRTAFVGNGSVVVDRPENVSELDVSASSVQTEAASRSDVEFRATVENDSTGPGADTGSMSTSGRLEVGPERYSLTAGMAVENGDAAAAVSRFRAEVSETTTGYRMQVEREYNVSGYSKARWDTRENATETLEQRFNRTATQLNGSYDLTVQRYAFTEAGDERYRLDLAYTVEFTGVEESVSEQLTEMLADEQNLTLTDSEAEAIAEKVTEMDVERVAASVETDDTTARMNLSVALSDYDDLYEATLDVMAAQAELTDEEQTQLTESRKRLAAVRESGLTRRVRWQGSMDLEASSVTVAYTMRARTDNWASYVDELQARDLEFVRTEYSASATTDGDQIRAEVSATVADEDLVDRLLRPGAGTADEAGGESADVLADLRAAGFERARLNASLSEREVTVRSAAKFRNLSALQSALAETFGEDVDAAVARLRGEETVTYVRLRDAVSGEVTESKVRALEPVDDNTTVNLPGEWDREFPEMDTKSAELYLGYDVNDGGQGNATATAPPTGTATGTPTETGTPGFGVAVALVALAGAALLARRRR